MLAKRGALPVFVLAMLAWSGSARGGGFEVADHGAQAIGRGATFVAKADDPSAIHHNPAGLARQRGTNLFASGNIFLHSYEFRRAGVFPDDPQNPVTPWGDRPFPAVTNSGPAFLSPFLALSTDFGTFDRLTVAAGVYGPSAIGNRTFPLAIQQAPASSRYDFIQSRSTIIYPTLGFGYRLTKWLDVGVSGHLAIGNFDQTQVTYADLPECANVEYQPCDVRSTLTASGTTVAGTFGVMLRPSESLAFGVSVRTPMGFQAAGTLTPQSPRIADIQLQPGAATLYTDLPLVVRTGARYVSMDQDFEVYDLELDLVYEQWGTAQREGPVLIVPNLGQFTDIRSVVTHRYKDTFSIRGGGAYNLDALDGVVSLRAGGFFDTPATEHPYTRLDFDTLAKVAGTLGVGYRAGAYGIDLGYAAIASIPRVVGTGVGDVRPLNGARGGLPVDANDQPLPAVNEGAYRGFTHVVSIGVTLTFDAFFGPMRPIRYGNSYERGVVAEPSPEPEPEKEPKREPEPEPDPEPEAEPEPAAKPPPRPAAKPAPKPAPKPADDEDEDEEEDEEEEAKPAPKPPAPSPPPPPPETTKPPKKEEKPPSTQKPWWEQLDD